MSEWIKCSERLPEKLERSEFSDSDLDYNFSADVIIKANKEDRGFFRIYPDGEAPAYYDFDDEVWCWSEFSGSPMLRPGFWRKLKK